MNIAKKAFKHFKKITKHKLLVCKYCFKFHLYKRGLLHDNSKYNIKEFYENIKYYNDNKSPIQICREQNGFSKAWLHHKGRNPHHWEYWVDLSTNPLTLPIIPYEYQIEMLCDFIAAGQTYNKNWSPKDEYRWWIDNRDKIIMNEVNKKFIDNYLFELTKIDNYNIILNKKYAKNLYKNIIVNKSN